MVSARSARAEVVEANISFAEQVAHADPKKLLVLETVQDGIQIGGAATQFRQFRTEFLRRARLVQHETIEEFIDHAGIIDEQPGKEWASSTEFYVQLQDGRVLAEQFPQNRLGAERCRNPFELCECFVGIGRFGYRSQEACGAMLARKCRHRRDERNGTDSRASWDRLVNDLLISRNG